MTLAPGGVYICITPNRLTGPHDVSKFFDETAAGFHLKEYTNTELITLFKKVGFSKIKTHVGAKRVFIRFPVRLLVLSEWLLCKLPRPVRKAAAHSLPLRLLLNVRFVGEK